MNNPSITNQIIEEIENNLEWSEKFDRQVELEEKMRGMGIDRYWSQVARAKEEGMETTIGAVRRLLNVSVEKITKGIEEFLEACASGKPGRKHSAYKYLKLIEPQSAAFITARVVLDGITKGDNLVSLSRKVASLIEDELSFRAFKEQSPTKFKRIADKERRQDSNCYTRQRVIMRVHMRHNEITWEEWPAKDSVLVGSKLIEIMQETTGLIQEVTRTIDVKRQEVVIEATEETMAWINEEINRGELLSPVYLPTIIPPKPWTSPTEGGYWTPRVRRLALVKTYSKHYLDELAEHHMPDVYDAVNAMQHTAWRINPQMLEVVKQLWEAGSTLGEIPPAENHPLPAKPAFLEDGSPRESWTEEQLTQFKNWKRESTDTYTANAQLRSQRLQFVKILSIAESFAEEEELYFPHQLDFRGRAYAVPLFLNPQGSDLAKGLLEFANGVAITDDESAGWLAIHGSNSYGFDKASLQERVEWVEQHEDLILASAADPFGCTFWSDADKPFQFLAFCIEWAGFRREGFGYVSSLPVQMDGSCNGLQNFSAMLRDEIGGRAVNLLPAEKPNDIYQQVADLVQKRVEQDALSSDPQTAQVAQGWLKHGITRKVCKRPCMTLSYGAKQFGFKTQVYEDTVQPHKLKSGKEFPWEGSGWAAADYMGGLIWECVSEVVVAARQAMDWLQGAARLAAKEGLPVRWSTTDGLVILQAYPKMLVSRVELTFGGSRHLLTVASGPSKELDQNRQANGISPNWVHSMDAAHMRATVRRSWREGIRSFSLIHDSYGTHAGNAWALSQFLREEFVTMYATDVLAEFKAELEKQLPDGATLEELPAKGSLDLNAVLESDFFFA